MGLRAYFYGKLTSDSALNALGFNATNIFHAQTMNGAPDATVQHFILLAWQDRNAAVMSQRGPQRSWEQLVDVWMYDRVQDWDLITKASQRLQEICDEIFGVSTGASPGDGWISCVEWNGEGSDTYDEVYEALGRYASINIVGKGN